MQEFSLKGIASNKEQNLKFQEYDMSKTVLEFLLEKEIPIASSCSGKGVCKRCKVNGEYLACNYTVKRFIKEIGNTIEIDYI